MAIDPRYTVETIESILVGNEQFAEIDVTLTALTSLEGDVGLDDKIEPDAVYCLQAPDDVEIKPRADKTTLAGRIAEQYDGLGVTFTSAVADEYPSLRYLAPGSPTLESLVDRLLGDSSDSTLSTDAYGYTPAQEVTATNERPWIVCGWSESEDDPQLVRLNETGDLVAGDDATDHLQTWAKEFIENRLRAIE